MRRRLQVKRYKQKINTKGWVSTNDLFMKNKRQIEVFIAGCPICYDAIDLVNRLAGPDDEVTISDMTRSVVADRAKELDIRSIPCVVIDGEVPDCCQKGFPYEWEPLKAAGLGQPLSKS